MECKFANKSLSVEIGKFAKQANGSVVIRSGDTAVLVTAVMSKEPREGQSFFPLTVDYQEKFYAAGRIPGGFFKRETRPSSRATLTARLIDRPLRPLFPDGFLNDVHIVATTLSVDTENEPDILAQIGASIALEISDIPFSGPVAAVRVGRINGEYVLNPTPEQQTQSDIELLVSGTKTAIAMVEGGAKVVPEEDVLGAILFAHKEMQPIIEFQEKLRKEYGKPKASFTPKEEDLEAKNAVSTAALPKLRECMHIREKQARYDAISQAKKSVLESLLGKLTPEEKAVKKAEYADFFDQVKEKYARSYTLKEKKRIDQRGYGDIRNITCEVGLLPRAHGSALFTRGETQALAVVTLGTGEDAQRVDALEGETSEAFMLHYNFPPFSVGEAGFMRGPGRREIGHGALAQRSLTAILPNVEQFPYTIRVVSEILESNGSSSMASVCGGTLAMMDAGVPVKAPVAGIAMGLIKEGKDIAILSDILGDEDGFGDMDFKVCGTQEGVTALQMDIKIEGLSQDIMEKALHQAKVGRLHILEKMKEALSQNREDISPYAPRIHQMTIDKEKIRDVIGTGGKVIRGIIEKTGVKMDINDDGVINIASANGEALQQAIQIVTDIVTDPEVGKVYKGKVIKLMDFGAFVEILPGKEGLVHISEIAAERVENVADYLKEGDEVEVKVIGIDGQGKIKLSKRVLIPGEEERPQPQRASGGYGRGPRSGGFGGGRGGDRGGQRGGGRGGRGGGGRYRD